MSVPIQHRCLSYASIVSGIDIPTIVGGGRRVDLARLRWAIMLVLKGHGWSLSGIARFLKMDPTTVHHGVNRAIILLINDHAFNALFFGMADAVAKAEA